MGLRWLSQRLQDVFPSRPAGGPPSPTRQSLFLPDAAGEVSEATRVRAVCRNFPIAYHVYLRAGDSADMAWNMAVDFTNGLFIEPIDKDRQPKEYRFQKFERQGRFRHYVARAAEHYRTDEHRQATAAKRGGKAVFDSRPELLAELRSVTTDPTHSVDHAWAVASWRELLPAVRDRCRCSDADFQTYIDSLCGNGMSDSEIAQAVGKPVGTVRRQKTSIRLYLRSALNDLLSDDYSREELDAGVGLSEFLAGLRPPTPVSE